LLLFCLLFIYLASIRRIIRLSSVGPLCLIFLCLFGPLPSSFAMLPHRTRNSSPTVASAPALVSGTLASASISPEIFSFGNSGHSDTNFGHSTAVVILPFQCKAFPPFLFKGCQSHLWSITWHIWTPLACTNLGLQPLPRHLSHQQLLGRCL